MSSLHIAVACLAGSVVLLFVLVTVLAVRVNELESLLAELQAIRRLLEAQTVQSAPIRVSE